MNTTPDPIDLFVGARIRAARRHAGVSQEALAEAIGVTFQQVQKYERGTNRISASMLARTAGRLGLAIGDFFPQADAGDEPSPARPRAADRLVGLTYGPQLVDTCAELGPQMRHALLEIAQQLLRVETTPAAPVPGLGAPAFAPRRLHG